MEQSYSEGSSEYLQIPSPTSPVTALARALRKQIAAIILTIALFLLFFRYRPWRSKGQTPLARACSEIEDRAFF